MPFLDEYAPLWSFETFDWLSYFAKSRILVYPLPLLPCVIGVTDLGCAIHLSFFVISVGSFLHLLHNNYVKGGLALGSLLGPGRGQFVLISYTGFFSLICHLWT